MSMTLHDAARRAARRYGTPFYLYDLKRLRRDALTIIEAFPDPWLRLYSLKANALPGLCRELAGLGFGASAVSRGEIALAQRAGFPRTSIALEGIGKSTADLVMAMVFATTDTPLLWVSVESVAEAAALAQLVADMRQVVERALRIDVLVRVNPGVVPETRRGWAVGRADSKFGVLAEELPDVIAAGGGPDGPLRWRGIHVHVGSQLGAVDAWRAAFRLGLRLLTLQRAQLPDFDTLDAGSGFPVDLEDPGSVPAPARFAEEAAAELDAVPAEARPARLAIEPGRAVVARSGWLVARVLHVRERDPRLVVLDAGMTELIRPALYGAEHPIAALTSLGRPVDPEASVAGAARVRLDGPICESTDRIGVAQLAPLERDDLVAIGLAGAYASSMASTYNGRPRAPEVAWDGGALRLLRRRGSEAALP